VSGLIRKLDDFVFDRRAVTGADTFNPAAIKRRAMNVGLQDPLSFCGGAANVAGDLRPVDFFGKE
jgi:hypothetical protein